MVSPLELGRRVSEPERFLEVFLGLMFVGTCAWQLIEHLAMIPPTEVGLSGSKAAENSENILHDATTKSPRISMTLVMATSHVRTVSMNSLPMCCAKIQSPIAPTKSDSKPSLSSLTSSSGGRENGVWGLCAPLEAPDFSLENFENLKLRFGAIPK